jgi:hypothetical protein
LAIEQWSAVVDQGSGLVGNGVDVADQLRRRIHERTKVIAGVLEPTVGLVEQGTNLVLGHAANEGADLIEHGSNGLGDGGVGHGDDRSVV